MNGWTNEQYVNMLRCPVRKYPFAQCPPIRMCLFCYFAFPLPWESHLSLLPTNKLIFFNFQIKVQSIQSLPFCSVPLLIWLFLLWIFLLLRHPINFRVEPSVSFCPEDPRMNILKGVGRHVSLFFSNPLWPRKSYCTPDLL